MKLLIDVGNTRIKWAWQQAGWLGEMKAALHRDQDFSRVLADSLRAAIKPSSIVVANVAGIKAMVAIEQWAQTTWNIRPEFVASELFAHGVRNAYQVPAQLGVDRWMGLIAARAMVSKPMCVVSCGTALTVDGLAGDGIHLGGVIAPGFNVMRGGLRAGTALIQSQPHPEDAPLKNLILLADNTDDAVAAGIGYALAGLVERVFARIGQSQAVAPNCVLTGGDAETLSAYLSIPHVCVADLVLRGLARVAAVPK